MTLQRVAYGSRSLTERRSLPAEAAIILLFRAPGWRGLFRLHFSADAFFSWGTYGRYS